MNRRLLDPFQFTALPEHIEEYLDHGLALCMAFNRRGTLLASGTREGQVVLWDFDTRGVASVLSGHEGPVTSVSWSRDGRYLLSGSEDQRVILWNVADGSQLSRVSLGCPVLRVALFPNPGGPPAPSGASPSAPSGSPSSGPSAPPQLGLVCLAEGPPVLLDLFSQRREPLPGAGEGVEVAGGGSVALFSRNGELVISGHLRGLLTVIDTAARRIVDVVRVPNSTRVTDLVLNRPGNLLLATCADQRVRMYEVVVAGGGPTRGSLGGRTHGSPEPQQLQEHQQQAAYQYPSDAQLAEALANKSIKSGSLLYGAANNNANNSNNNNANTSSNNNNNAGGGGVLRPVRD
ncbi:hypothetical protein Agub_g1380, partial [Astrephomene gubernaculifera]